MSTTKRINSLLLIITIVIQLFFPINAFSAGYQAVVDSAISKNTDLQYLIEDGNNTGLETGSNETAYTVTPEKAATAKYQYEPGNVMVTGYNPNATNKVVSARLSWKNPLSENLNAISVYKIASDGSESLLTNNVNKTPGATAYVTDRSFASGTTSYGSASYRIVFGFSDGETREVIYTGKWNGDTGVALSEVGFSRYLITSSVNQQLPEIMTSYSNTEKYGTVGNSLVLESNRYIDSTISYSRYELNAGNILTAGQSYKLSMMVKAPESATLKNNSGGGTINIPATGNGWAEVSQTFTATSAAFIIAGESIHREIYIDDLKIVKTSDNSIAYSFASKTIDALELKSVLPTNINAVAGNAIAKFSWSKPTSGYYINVYEKDADGNLMLRAKVAASAEGVKLSNLKNDIEHTFVIKTQDANGLETAASGEINVTPIDFTAKYQSLVDSAISKSTELQSLIKNCNDKGIYPDYEMADCECVKVFAQKISDEYSEGLIADSEYYAEFIDEVYAEVKPRLQSYIYGKAKPVEVARYKSGTNNINGKDLIITDEAGTEKSSVVMGFNFFRSTDESLPEMNNLGFNATQFDSWNLAPSILLKYENGEFVKTDDADTYLNMLRTTLNACRSNDILVDCGAPIHYVNAEWKMSDFISSGGSYDTCINFNPTSDTAKKLITAYYKLVIPVIDEYKDIVCSITYVNEPHFEAYDKSYYYGEWTAFLKSRYNNDIASLNKAYGKNYQAFDDVLMPDENYDIFSKKILYYDYKLFISEIMYEFFENCKTEIRKYTDIPCGVKTMQFINKRMLREWITYDYERFADLFDFNGTDTFSFLTGDVNLNIPTKLAWYDLITSICEKPIIDSETHVALDGTVVNREELHPQFMSSSMWMGAMHDCDVTAAWIYADSELANTFSNASFRNRPYELRMYAKNSLDSARLSDEINAFQEEKREVGILYSYENLMTDDEYPNMYDDNVKLIYQTYEALTSMGQRPFFVSNGQLEKLDRCKVLVVTKKSALDEEISAKIAEFVSDGGKVIYKEDYYTDISFNAEIEETLEELGMLKINLDVPIGVEWNAVEKDNEILISACNYTEENVNTRVTFDGVECTNIDDIKNMEYGIDTVTLEPFKPVLLKLADPYEYYPRDMIVSGINNSGTYGVRLSWKNPNSEKLTKVTVYSVSDDTYFDETLLGTIESPTAGEVQSIDKPVASEAGRSFYKLVFEFSDGKKNEIYYRGYYKCTAWDMLVGSLSIVGYYNANAGGALPEVFVGVSAAEKVSGTKSLSVTSNIPAGATGYYKLFTNRLSSNMAANTAYKMSMKVKASADTVVPVVLQERYTVANLSIEDTDGAWVTKEIEFTTQAEITNFEFRINNASEKFYIDDIKIVDSETGETTIYNQDFEAHTKAYAAPGNIAVLPGDSSAVFTWDNSTVGANSEFITIYEKMSDGTLAMKARVWKGLTGITLNNLENGKTYNFVVTAETTCGLETDRKATPYTVTPEKAATVKYEYEPGNVMVTGYNPNATNKVVSARLSWKNPLSENLNAVSVYKIAADGTESLLANNVDKTPGATAYVTDNSFASGTTSYGSASYRIVFGFSDGETREVIYTGKWSGDTGAALSEVGFSRYLITNAANQQLPEIMTSYSNTERYGTTGNSFVLESNRYIDSAVAYSKYELHTGSVLTTGQTYKLSMMVKAPESATLTNKSGGVAINIPATGSGWAEVTQTFTATSAAFVISGETPHREIYIDDLKIVKTSDNSVAYSFASKTIDALELKSVLPTNISAVAGNATATFSWTKPASGYYINVYEKDIYGNLMLRAKVAASAEGVKLSNLKNDIEHTFVIKTQDANGLETSASDEINVTPIAPDYEISKPMLLSGATEATTLTDGTYSAKATVKNNKITSGMSAQLIVAVYNGKVLEKCYVSTKATVSAGNSHPVTIDEIVISDTANKDYSVKVMLWKGLDNLVPWNEYQIYNE